MADADFPKPRIASAIIAPLHPAAPTAIDLIGGETVSERLRSAIAAIDGRIVLTTSFGMEAQLIAHHIFTERLPIEG